MPHTVTPNCATCGNPFETIFHADGTVEACFGHIITADTDQIRDNAPRFDELLDEEIDTGTGAVIYAECPDCCPKCNG